MIKHFLASSTLSKGNLDNLAFITFVDQPDLITIDHQYDLNKLASVCVINIFRFKNSNAAAKKLTEVIVER